MNNPDEARVAVSREEPDWYKRLAKAYQVQQPDAPDQMALVARGDLLEMFHSYWRLQGLATRDGAVERLREGLRRALVAADNLHSELEAHQENTGEDLEPEDQAVVHGALQDMAFARALLAEPAAEGEGK